MQKTIQNPSERSERRKISSKKYGARAAPEKKSNMLLRSFQTKSSKHTKNVMQKRARIFQNLDFHAGGASPGGTTLSLTRPSVARHVSGYSRIAYSHGGRPTFDPILPILLRQPRGPWPRGTPCVVLCKTIMIMGRRLRHVHRKQPSKLLTWKSSSTPGSARRLTRVSLVGSTLYHRNAMPMI